MIKSTQLFLVKKTFLIAALLLSVMVPVSGQNPDSLAAIRYKNYLKRRVIKLYTPGYIEWKSKIMEEFNTVKAGHFGEFVKGTYDHFTTTDSVIAFTFDACTGTKNDYNSDLVEYLRKENIPATLFVSGLWIDFNPELVKQLSNDTLFDLENHGLNHRLCSVTGAERFGITGTANAGEVVDEMELNSLKIEQITGRKPTFFRGSTVYVDEASAKIAKRLGMKIISYSIPTGDFDPEASARSICNKIIEKAKPGGIVIMHFNHPKWKEKQGLEMAIPKLRKMGYRFVKLKFYPLKEKY